VIREGPSRTLFWVALNRGNRYTGFALDSDPIQNNRVVCLPVENANIIGTLWQTEGEIPPSSPLNTTKNTPSMISVLDQGAATVKDGLSSTHLELRLKGAKLHGVWVVAKQKDSKLWTFVRSDERRRPDRRDLIAARCYGVPAGKRPALGILFSPVNLLKRTRVRESLIFPFCFFYHLPVFPLTLNRAESFLSPLVKMLLIQRFPAEIAFKLSMKKLHFLLAFLLRFKTIGLAHLNRMMEVFAPYQLIPVRSRCTSNRRNARNSMSRWLFCSALSSPGPVQL
jgi:hypothetical protein